MISTQAVLGGLIGLLAVLAHDLSLQHGVTSRTRPSSGSTLIAIGVVSATHDIACDGYYMDALDKPRQARYTGVRIAAFRAAMLVGNAGLVYVGGRYSWLLGFGVAAAMMVDAGAAAPPDVAARRERAGAGAGGGAEADRRRALARTSRRPTSAFCARTARCSSCCSC